MTASIGRLFRTVRHLRAGQIVNRVQRKLVQPRLRPMAPPFSRVQVGTIIPFLPRPASWDGIKSFNLLNLSADIDPDVSWQAPTMPHLWRYHLQYCEDLLRPDAGEWRDRHTSLVANWIAANPPGTADAYDPYPISLRSGAWVKWHLMGGALDDKARSSLASQLLHLEKRLEYHLLGNHLWANAKALAIVGMVFDGVDADRWLKRGMQILEQERHEQLLRDGGHFERSPSYHALITEDILDLINIARAHAIPLDLEWAETASRMLGWLAVMTRPDGKPVLWNDASCSMSPGLQALTSYAAALGIVPASTSRQLTDTGVSRFDLGDSVLWFDHAPIGADYIPGHAHADTLAIELFARGGPVFTDHGVSTYATGKQRARERGTASHNTVVVADKDSSELWAAFRVGRRARPLDIRISDTEATAAHDGYRHLGAFHRRTLKFGNGAIMIEDTIEGRGAKLPARAHFHLDRGISAVADGNTVRLSNGQIIEFSGCPNPTVESTEVACGFNRLGKSLFIAADFRQHLVTRIML